MWIKILSAILDALGSYMTPTNPSAPNNNMLPCVTKAMIECDKYKDKCKRYDYMLVVDFTEPSHRKRLHVVDVASRETIHSHYVAHGSGSASIKDSAYADKFSNTPESHCSSLGVMITDNEYQGKHGLSLRLIGLERGVNDNVYSRGIVIHAADYVTDEFIMNNGRAGCSWGCFAVDPAVSRGLIDMINGGVFVYAYYDK